MRILFLDQFSGLGGAQLCLQDILDEARGRGWSAELFAPGQGPLLDHARDCGFRVQRLPMVEYPTSRAAARNLLRFGIELALSAQAVRRGLRAHPVDLVYVNGPRILPAAYEALRDRPKIPLVFHAHSVPLSRYAQTVANWTLRRTGAAALACSRFAARPVEEAIGDCTVIYNGVPDCGFSPRHGRPGRVGMLGRVAPEKGHLDFLEAARILAADSGLRFRVAGAAVFSERRYERRIQTRCAEVGVEYLGWTNDPADFLHKLDILAVPSEAHEASTRVVMEAFSAGTCVVAYPSGGIPELIRNDASGVVTERRDPRELARAIRRLASDADLRARLVANGRREWELRFTVGRFQRQVCDLLQAIAERRTPRFFSNVKHSAGLEIGPARDETHA